jgi:hypothetical protein
MTTAAFYRQLDALLRDLDADHGVMTLGPTGHRSGRACCLSCSAASIEAENGGRLPARFACYHQQDRERPEAECYLAWGGDDVPDLVARLAAARGLRVDLPADPTARIVVRA